MKTITIATRGSQLALWQAEHVKSRMTAVLPGCEVQLLVLKTQGDKILDRPLAEIGGKALFVKEIEEALLDGRADIAVHSMKDMPAELAPGLTLAAISSREDPRDAWLSRSGISLQDIPQGARVGTSSLRRQCQLLALRSDLDVHPLRGNVPTRVAKLERGEYDAIVLASAGLRRLALGDKITESLAVERCLPAVGQGTLGIETRSDAVEMTARVRDALHDPDNADITLAERAFLARLGGGCQTPLAAHAQLDGNELVMAGLVGRPDGTLLLRDSCRMARTAAEELGQSLAEMLLSRGAQDIIDACG